jgi:fluoride exporter
LRLALICLGGAAGTAARYLVSGLAARWFGAEFPFGTLIVNVAGSLLIGLVQHVGLTTLAIPDTVRVMLTIGVLGGFTTYSSFSYETLQLVEDGAWGPAVLNVLVTTGLCLAACALGLGLGRALVGGR